MQSSASCASYMSALAEMHVIGGDQRQVLGIGEVDQRVFGGAFLRQGRGAAARHRAGRRTSPPSLSSSASAASGWPSTSRRLIGPPGPAGQRDQPFGMRGQHLRLHMRPVARLGLQIGGAQQLGEIAIAGLVLHQKADRGGLRREPTALAGGPPRVRPTAGSRRWAGCRPWPACR